MSVRLILAGAALACAPAAADAQGRVAAVRNIVRAHVEHGELRDHATLGRAVAAGDTVETGQGGIVQVRLRDGAVLTIGQARATLDRSGNAISVARGVVRFAAGTGAATLRTPAGEIAVAGAVVELLVGAPVLEALRRDAALRTALGCNKPGCADPEAVTLVLLRTGRATVTAGGRTVTVAPARVVAIGGPGKPPSDPLPLSITTSEQFDRLLSTTPNPQEQRGVVDEIAAALADALKQPAKDMLPAAGRVAMDYKDDPVSTQAALARAAAGLTARSPTRETLARLALAVMAASDVAAVGVLADDLSAPAGARLLDALPEKDRPLLEDAIIKLVGAPPAPSR